MIELEQYACPDCGALHAVEALPPDQFRLRSPLCSECRGKKPIVTSIKLSTERLVIGPMNRRKILGVKP